MVEIGASTGSYTARADGTARITAQVTGRMVSNSITITVDATAPTTSNHTFSLDENVATGTAVGTVVATDSGGISGYTITAGNTSNAFAIDNNGVITTAAAIDYEIKSNYSLTVQVADNVRQYG